MHYVLGEEVAAITLNSYGSNGGLTAARHDLRQVMQNFLVW